MVLAVGAVVLAVGAGLVTWTPVSAAEADDEEMPSVTLRAARMTTRPAHLNAVDSSGYLSSPSPAEPSSLSTWVGNDGSTVECLPTPVAANGGFGLERVKETNIYRIRHYATGKVAQVDLPATDTATQAVNAEAFPARSHHCRPPRSSRWPADCLPACMHACRPRVKYRYWIFTISPRPNFRLNAAWVLDLYARTRQGEQRLICGSPARAASCYVPRPHAGGP